MGGAREACLFYHKRALLVYAGANPAESKSILTNRSASRYYAMHQPIPICGA